MKGNSHVTIKDMVFSFYFLQLTVPLGLIS
nr:MAG TPA: hypothetical protein [Bacteriophage sp.]